MRPALVVLLLACGRGPPDAWAVEWNGTPPLAGLERALAMARDAGAAECPAGGEALRGGLVRFRPEPFACGSLPCVRPDLKDCAVGCAWDWTYDVLWRLTIPETALWDELGHEVWLVCHGRTGENAANQYDPDFAAWLSALRAAW